MERTHLRLELALPIQACNAGLFISRGQGRHPDRVIDSYELIFVRSGVLNIQEENRPFAVGPDQFLLLCPHRRHWGIAPFPPDLSFYWLHFYLRESKEESQTALAIPQHGMVSRPESLTELFRRFLDNQEAGRNHPPIGDLLIALMLCEVAGAGTVDSAVDRAAVLANRAEAYIRTHFHEPISASLIAEKLGCNPDYLERQYKRVYGRTITEEIHARRIRYARILLMDDTKNVEEIAFACGFNDPAYFRRLFKRREGLTPSAYRRLYAKIHVNTG